MTTNVPVSITIKIGENKREVISLKLDTSNFGENLRNVQQKIQQQLGAEIIKYLDDEYKVHEGKNYKNLGTESRRVITIAGTLEYRRRIYQLPEGGRYSPIDQMLGFEPYARRDKHLQELNCTLAARSNYRETAQISTLIVQNNVSPSTIGRDVCRIGHQLAEYDKNFYTEKAGTIRSNVLYGESDGIFIRLQKDKEKKKFAEIRACIAYTDKKWLSGNRKHLVNKTTITAMDISSLRWQEMVRNHLYSKYDLYHVKLLAVGGDGGSWVGSTFDLCGVKSMQRVLDPFHIKKAIRSAFSDSVDLPSLYDKLFKEGFESVSDILKPLLDKGKPSVRKIRHSCFSYLENHSDELLPLTQRHLPFDNLQSLGCMESNIGKTIALRMKTRGCSWSRTGAESMAAILCHLPELESHSFSYSAFMKINDINIKSQRKHKSADQPQIHQASFPIVSSGKASAPYYQLFRDIINSNELL